MHGLHQATFPQQQTQSIGHVEVFNPAKWQIDLNKIPNFTKFDGTTQHYRAWHLQLENFLSTINPKWIDVLKMVREMPHEIRDSTFNNTTMSLGLSGDNLLQLSSIAFSFLTARYWVHYDD